MLVSLGVKLKWPFSCRSKMGLNQIHMVCSRLTLCCFKMTIQTTEMGSRCILVLGQRTC